MVLSHKLGFLSHRVFVAGLRGPPLLRLVDLGFSIQPRLPYLFENGHVFLLRLRSCRWMASRVTTRNQGLHRARISGENSQLRLLREPGWSSFSMNWGRCLQWNLVVFPTWIANAENTRFEFSCVRSRAFHFNIGLEFCRVRFYPVISVQPQLRFLVQQAMVLKESWVLSLCPSGFGFRLL